MAAKSGSVYLNSSCHMNPVYESWNKYKSFCLVWHCMVRSLWCIRGKCGLETQWGELIQCMLMQVMRKGESEKEMRLGLAYTLMANDWSSSDLDGAGAG